jgi:hypothetical protein
MLGEIGAGHGALLFFTGEAGIGKSRLGRRIEDAARDRGMRIAWGRCWEAGGAPAFWPWMQIFDTLGLQVPLLTTAAAEGEDRFRQFDRAARLVADQAASEPLVLVFDDLHAADVSSLTLLLRVARALRSTRLGIVGFYRDAEARVGATAPVLAKIAREGEAIGLSRLAPDEVTTLIRSSVPDASDATCTQVHRVTEGNPLFVHSLLNIGKLQLDARQLPDGLSAVLDEQLALIPPDVRDLLASATVFGREAGVAAAAAIGSANLDMVETAFESAVRSGVMEPVAGVRDRYAFRHVLLRDRLYLTLSSSRRSLLHWRAGEELAARGDIANAAFHLLEGLTSGQPARAAQIAQQAAAIAMARFAFEDAASLATRGVEALRGTSEPRLACELEILRAEARIRVGEPGARDDSARAAKLAREVGSPVLLARAALAYGAELTTATVDDEMVELLRDALVALGNDDDLLRARLMARLAAALTPPNAETFDEVLHYGRSAVALARNLRDTDTMLYVCRFAMIALGYHVDRRECFELARDTTALAAEHDRPLVLLDAAGWSMCTLREEGQLAEAARALDRYDALATEMPRPQYRYRVPLFRATFAMLEGELDVAEWLGRDSLASADADSMVAQLGWMQHRIALAIVRDDPSSILPDAERMLAIVSRAPRLWAFEAWLLAALGRSAQARELIAGKTFEDFEYPMVIVAAEAITLLRDRDLAQRCHDALAMRPKHSKWFWGGPVGTTAIGPRERELANLSVVLGRIDDAHAYFDAAIATAEHMGAKQFVLLARRGKAALGAPSSPPLTSQGTASLICEGEAWRLGYAGRVHVLKARRGLLYLAALLRDPDRALHVLELSAIDAESEPRAKERGTPVLDATTKAAYRARLEQLEDREADAKARGDVDAAERAHGEIDAIAAELARALGLGGRDRTTTTAADRARAAVTLAIRRAIDAIADVEAELGGHLEHSIKTGAFCAYRPDPRARMDWSVP